VAKGSGDAVNPVQPQEIERGIAASGEILGAVAEFDATAVLAEGHVPHPVEFVFNVPVPAPERKQQAGISSLGSQAGDGVLHLDGFFAIAMRGALQPTDLCQAGPVEMFREARASLQMSPDDAAVSLLDFAGARELLLALFLVRRGKKRASTRPRWLPSTRAGCL
jgi:hypothetical protein